ncbi:hypothetical protein [Desulfogranum marinum]|uniref:hypothetical protein n=1 Tax=Desulfogranum marinum TaxID=453220 RepID=UPI0029C7AEBC|nr:hypothetical protein [Desulfogranum marinum]
MNWLKDSALALALISTALYCASTSYFVGVCKGFNLNSELLEKSFHFAVYSGFVTLSNKIVEKFRVLIDIFFDAYVPIIGCIIIIAFLFQYYISLSFSNKRKVVRIKKILSLILSNAFRIKKYPSALAVGVVISYITVIALFQGVGYNAAIDTLSDVKKGKIERKYVSNITLDGKEREVYVITCGLRNCAAIDIITLETCHFAQGKNIYSQVY